MRNEILRLITCLLLVIAVVSFSSCNKEDEPEAELATISGTVSDESGEAVSGVSVTIKSAGDSDITTTTAADGTYMVEGLEAKTYSATFSKEGWLTVSVTIAATKFDANNLATVDVTMVNASAKIVGTVVDGSNGDVPLAGVNVSIGSESTTTGEDGTFEIANLVEDSYTVTFSKETFVTVSKNVSASDFADGIATVNATLGANELLRGLTSEDLAMADKWYFNEYRGGRNADAYPHWDWACDYMSTLDFRGAWEEQNEGTTLQIRNSDSDQGNPADLDVFDSFVFGSKLISAENKIMSVRLRTHNADEAAPAYYGVQVVDLSAAEPAPVKIADKTYGSGDYADIEFDLSAYVGKEVIIAIGIYRQSTGDYWKQLVLRAIRFADKKVENTDWLPGTEVIAGWALTKETVKSTMPHTKSFFTGISTVGGNRDNYVDAYRSWRDNDHIAANWSFVPLKKDPEVFPSEGYIIKTRNTGEVSTTVPEAYMYAKFSITGSTDQLTLTTRNFGDNYTYFKLTAIENDGTVTQVEPTSNTAQEASAASDGCWKFKHGNGGADSPEAYASFVYDLSAFTGKDVTLAFGVYNGAADTGENKLVFHTITLN